jgi:hypothetical protein
MPKRRKKPVDVYISYKRYDHDRVDLHSGLHNYQKIRDWHDASLAAGERRPVRI